MLHKGINKKLRNQFLLILHLLKAIYQKIKRQIKTLASLY